MAFFCRLCFLALATTAVDAAKHTRSPAQEKAAQALVATLLHERDKDVSVIETMGTGIMQWLPAGSSKEDGGTSHEEAEREIRQEFEEVLGKDLVPLFEEDLESIKKELQTTYRALQKNEYGELGFAGVRYALHRLFVARHGWYIQGIDPEGGNFHELLTPSDMLKGHVPVNVQQLIEKLLYGRGFGLSEVALLAAILENLIHQEAATRATAVYRMLDMDHHEKMAPGEVDRVIDFYMASYIMGQDASKLTKRAMVKIHAGMDDAYPGWKATQEFSHTIRQEKFGDQHLTFKETVPVLVTIGEKFGSFQQRECMDLKQRLVGLENRKDGCVPLSSFYKGMREEGKWQFSESPDYLRELGSLDESDTKNPRVMTANYIDGFSNCVASSSYYSVCCINECEGILSRVELLVKAPDAVPGELARLISAIPSSSVPSGSRSLPAPLLQQLEKIADAHGGRVPLHSRLFMQWMHNAYPNECPYPHAAGRTSPRLPEVWMAATHKDATASKAEMDDFAAKAESKASAVTRELSDAGQCGQWLDQEELYVPWDNHAATRHEIYQAENEAHVWVGAYSVAIFASIASLVLVVIKTAKSCSQAGRGNKIIMETSDEPQAEMYT